jgi:hypothetical protein
MSSDRTDTAVLDLPFSTVGYQFMVEAARCTGHYPREAALYELQPDVGRIRSYHSQWRSHRFHSWAKLLTVAGQTSPAAIIAAQ